MKVNFLLLLAVVFVLSACKDTKSPFTPLPYSQDFESATYPPTGWVTFPIGADTNWVRNTAVSVGKGTACISFNNFAPMPSNGYRGLRLPPMDFTTIKNPYIRFDIAYAQRMVDSTTILSDMFGLYWSADTASSSRSWNSIMNYDSASLSTAAPTPDLFVPTSTQWQTKLVALPMVAGKPVLRLALEDDWNHGNVMYVDNIVVFDSVVGGK